MTTPKLSLSELEALEKAATKGPWRWWRGYGISPRIGETISMDSDEMFSLDEDESDAMVDAPPEGNSNAALCIAMRNHLPTLLAIARAAHEWAHDPMSQHYQTPQEERLRNLAFGVEP